MRKVTFLGAEPLLFNTRDRTVINTCSINGCTMRDSGTGVQGGYVQPYYGRRRAYRAGYTSSHHTQESTMRLVIPHFSQRTEEVYPVIPCLGGAQGGLTPVIPCLGSLSGCINLCYSLFGRPLRVHKPLLFPFGRPLRVVKKTVIPSLGSLSGWLRQLFPLWDPPVRVNVVIVPQAGPGPWV